MARPFEAESRHPRRTVLLRGLHDWVALDRIHWDVAQAMPDMPLGAIQKATLSLIDDLLRDGLFEVGTVTAERGFVRWDVSSDEAIERIRHFYIEGFDDSNVWPWCCWLDLTERGNQVARREEQEPWTSG